MTSLVKSHGHVINNDSRSKIVFFVQKIHMIHISKKIVWFFDFGFWTLGLAFKILLMVKNSRQWPLLCVLSIIIAVSILYKQEIYSIDGYWTFNNIAMIPTQLSYLFCFSVPIYLAQCHWSLTAVSFQDKTIGYYDSLGWDGTQVIENIIKYLKAAHLHQKEGNELNLSKFTIDRHVTGIPQQVNNNDCGVFVMKVRKYYGREMTNR